MAIFSSLPQELIDHIVKLSVEDEEALDRNFLRRPILVQLALVSKAFVLPSRRALWAIIEYVDLNDKVMELLTQGIASDIIVEQLSYVREDKTSTNAEQEDDYKLIHILKSIKGVVKLEFIGAENLEELQSIFDIPSTQYLQHLSIFGLKFGSSETRIPSLRTLNWVTESDYGVLSETRNPLFQLFEDQTSSSITSLSFPNLSPDDYNLNFARFFQIHGSNIKSLRLGFVDFDTVKLILPHTPSLKYFRTLSIEDANAACSLIRTLPNNTRLRTLELPSLIFPEYPHDSITNSQFLSSLISLVQISQLETLICTTRTLISFHTFEEFEQAKEDFISEFVFYVDQCRKKGIQLIFWRQELDREFAEIEKQLEYEYRQEELDALNLVHA